MKFLLILFAILTTLFMNVAMVIAGWWLFVVPVFHLPSLTFSQAVGAALLIGLFREGWAASAKLKS